MDTCDPIIARKIDELSRHVESIDDPSGWTYIDAPTPTPDVHAIRAARDAVESLASHGIRIDVDELGLDTLGGICISLERNERYADIFCFNGREDRSVLILGRRGQEKFQCFSDHPANVGTRVEPWIRCR